MTAKTTDFLGRWSIDRTIEDAQGTGSAHFTGSAVIKECGDIWEFSESGTLSLAQGSVMRAERKYLWRPAGAGFDVFFEDQRFFHHFDLGADAQASHWCDPDQYDVSYDFTDWPNWSSRWNVAGPRKAYIMQSQFRPMP